MRAAGRVPVAVLLAAALAGCGGSDEPDLPGGFWAGGDAAALTAFLRQLESFHGSPLARLSAAARPRLEDCEAFVAHLETADGKVEAEEGPGLFFEALRCREAGEDLAFLDVLRAPHDDRKESAAVVLVPLGGAHLIVRAWPRGAGLRGAGWLAEIELPEADLEGPATLLLPAASVAGKRVLASRDVLFQGRFAAEKGLDFGEWIDAESAADRLFRLRSQLFSGLVLNGVWEVAMYMPAAGESVPPIVVAAEYNERRTAEAAMQSFLGEVEATWRIVRSPFVLDGHSGACYRDLRLLPDLAPCYLLTGRAVVIGWNAESLERALVTGEPATVPEGPSRLVVDLERFPEAETLLQETLRDEEDRTDPLGYPWRRLDLSGWRDGDRYRFVIRLEP